MVGIRVMIPRRHLTEGSERPIRFIMCGKERRRNSQLAGSMNDMISSWQFAGRHKDHACQVGRQESRALDSEQRIPQRMSRAVATNAAFDVLCPRKDGHTPSRYGQVGGAMTQMYIRYCSAVIGRGGLAQVTMFFVCR
jgi:hypothetical protein